MSFISASLLSKNYLIADKKPGIKGTFKHFFASHLKQVNNTHISNKIVSGLIKNMIAHESSEKKFSDQQLTDLLKKEYGIQIARRTVSKYRQSLGILSTKYRRKLNH